MGSVGEEQWLLMRLDMYSEIDCKAWFVLLEIWNFILSNGTTEVFRERNLTE